MPLINCVVVDKNRLYLHSSQEAVFTYTSIVDIESDNRFLGSDIAEGIYQ